MWMNVDKMRSMDLKCKDPGGLVCRDLGAYTVV